MKLTLQTARWECSYKFALWRRVVHDYVRDDYERVLFFDNYGEAKRYVDRLDASNTYAKGMIDVWEVSTGVDYLPESPVIAGSWAARLLSAERYGADPTSIERHDSWKLEAYKAATQR